MMADHSTSVPEKDARIMSLESVLIAWRALDLAGKQSSLVMVHLRSGAFFLNPCPHTVGPSLCRDG